MNIRENEVEGGQEGEESEQFLVRSQGSRGLALAQQAWHSSKKEVGQPVDKERSTTSSARALYSRAEYLAGK